RAAEPEDELRRAGRPVRGTGLRTPRAARVLVVGRCARRYAGQFPTRTGRRGDAPPLRALGLRRVAALGRTGVPRGRVRLGEDAEATDRRGRRSGGGPLGEIR